MFLDPLSATGDDRPRGTVLPFHIELSLCPPGKALGDDPNYLVVIYRRL
jgi:hypothetical protein